MWRPLKKSVFSPEYSGFMWHPPAVFVASAVLMADCGCFE